MNTIPKPVLNDLRHFKRGRIKFINIENGFGFVTDIAGNDLFVHPNWLCCPEIEVIGSHYNIALYPSNEPFPMDQPVLYREMKGAKGLEAHNVVDELKVQFLRRELTKQYELACQVWGTLTMYKATLIKQCHKPEAVKGGQYRWKEAGQKQVELFKGNNLSALATIIQSPTVQIALTQPGSEIRFQELINSQWVECECPI